MGPAGSRSSVSLGEQPQIQRSTDPEAQHSQATALDNRAGLTGGITEAKPEGRVSTDQSLDPLRSQTKRRVLTYISSSAFSLSAERIPIS